LYGHFKLNVNLYCDAHHIVVWYGGEGQGTYQVGCTISNRNEILMYCATRFWGNRAELKMSVVSDMTLCRMVFRYRRLGGASGRHHVV